MKYFAAVIVGYLLGSVNFAVMLSSFLQKKDVRAFGSGNAGATNMARTFGLGSGLGTMAGDMAKTALAIILGKLLIGDAGIAFGGLSCLLGHCFPVFYGFKGGKGVAVCGIIFLFASPLFFLVAVAVFLSVAFLSRKVSLGSVSSALAGALLCWFSPASLCTRAGAVIAALTVVLMHRANLARLIKGTEPDFVLPEKYKVRKNKKD